MKKFIKLLFTKGYKQILSFTVPAFFLFFIWYKVGIFYSTNDDRCITEMLAGLVTSHNESHLVYINYLLGLPLAFLYKLTPSIPWFGAFLIGLYYFSYVFILKGFYSRSKNIVEDIISTGVISCVALSSFYLVGQITYTSIAILAAAAGYCALLLHTEKFFGLTYFIILESLAYLLRDQSMLMIQPLGLSVLCMYIFISEKSTLKKNIINCLKIVGIVVSIIIILFVGNKLGYINKNWNNYNQFNESRTILCDYTQYPDYKDVKDILDKYNVSQKTYDGLCSYTILDWDIPLECYDELAQYALKNTSTKTTLSDSFETYSTILFESKNKYYNITNLLILTFIMTAIYIIISRKLKSLLPLTGLVLSQAVVWIYLIYRGRLPHRVTIPLLVSEILLLITILYLTHTKTLFRKYISLVRIVILMLMLGLFFKSAYTSYQMQHKDSKIQNNIQDIFIEGLTDITDYCNHFPENRYIVDTMSLRWYYGSALQTNIFEPRNYTFAGGWFSNTPCFIEKNEAYFIDNSNGFYFIVSLDSETEVLEHPSTLYLAEKSSCEPIISDTFTASHGGIYYVVYFDGALKLNLQP